MSRRVSFLATALLLSATVAGCGGSSGANTSLSTTTATQHSTHLADSSLTAYIKRADSDCLTFFGKAKALEQAVTVSAGSSLLKPRNRPGLAMAILNLDRAAVALSRKLHSIPASQSVRAKVSGVLGELTSEFAWEKKLAVAVAGNNRAATVRALSGLESSKLTFEAHAQAAGFKVCGASTIPGR